jgi:hypothetical protein
MARTLLGIQPSGRPCWARGVGACSVFKTSQMRRMPLPSRHSLKMRRTKAAL